MHVHREHILVDLQVTAYALSLVSFFSETASCAPHQSSTLLKLFRLSTFFQYKHFITVNIFIDVSFCFQIGNKKAAAITIILVMILMTIIPNACNQSRIGEKTTTVGFVVQLIQ